MNTTLLMATLYTCAVGCESNDREALHILACDGETGAAKIVQTVRDLKGTTYFQFDCAHRNLYTVISETRDGQRRSAAVRFPVAADGRLGAMARLSSLPCEAPCHVALSPDESLFAFAAYSSATCGNFPLAAVPSAPTNVKVLPDVGMGPNARRQKKAYAHCAFFTPDGFMGIVDLGTDKIHFFDPNAVNAKPKFTLGFDRGDGPRHAIFSKDGRFLYVLNELASTVSAFAWAGANTRRLAKVTMLPPEYDPREPSGESRDTKAAAIKLTSDGRILMASNRGHDSIAFYAVDTATGMIELKNIVRLAGREPRDFELFPNERFMVVGHQYSDEIRVYRFDRAAYSITPVGEAIPCVRPLCFKF